MADSQNLETSIPVDQILGGQDQQKLAPGERLYVAPHKDTPSIKESIPFDAVFDQFKKNQEAKPKAPEDKSWSERLGDNFRKGAISDDNKKLGAIQFTSQAPNDEHYIAPATQGKDFDWGDPHDDTYYYKDDKGEYQAADKNKHLVFRNPESGEYGLYKRDTEKDYGPITGRLVGLGNLVQEGFQAAPTRLPSAVAGATRGQQALGAAQRVEETTDTHVPVPQHNVTENKVSPLATRAVESLPGGEVPFARAEGNMEGGIAAAHARATSDATSAEGAGSTARSAIENTAAPKEGVLAKRVSAAYDKVDAHMPDDAIRDLSETRKVAENIQSRFDATKGAEGSTKVDNPTIQTVLSAATDPKGISYPGLKDLRTRIGEMLEQKTNISETGVSDKELRALYKGLTDDIRGMVEEHGGTRGLELWKRANNIAKWASERRETLGKILGTTRSDEAVFSALERMAGSTSTADAQTLTAAKRSMPADEWNEIASTVASRLGKVRTEKGTTFDPNKFVKDYDKMSDRGKALLFGDQQRLRKALDAISDLAKFSEPVGQPGQIAHLLTAGLVLNHAHGGEGGMFSRLGHIMGAVASMRVLGNMLSKPATAESVARWMQGYKLAILKPTKGNVSLFQRASESLANDAAQEDRDNIKAGAWKAADLAKELMAFFTPMGHNGQ